MDSQQILTEKNQTIQKCINILAPMEESLPRELRDLSVTETLTDEKISEKIEALIELFVTGKEHELFVQVLKNLKKDGDLWELLCTKFIKRVNQGLPGIQTILDLFEQAGLAEEIQNLLDWNQMEKDMVAGAERILLTDTYPDYRDRFMRLTQCILGFYECVYGEDFRDREVLPNVCVMALVIEDGMQCEDEPAKFVEIIKQCASIYPSLGKAIKRWLTLYLQEPERKEHEAKKELKKLRNHLLGQAKNLIAVGKKQEADMILRQLKTVVPNDLEIAALSLENRIALVDGL